MVQQKKIDFVIHIFWLLKTRTKKASAELTIYSIYSYLNAFITLSCVRVYWQGCFRVNDSKILRSRSHLQPMWSRLRSKFKKIP